MSVETLQYIQLAAYIVAGILLLGAIVLFFVLKIPAVIGDLTGSTAKKAIASIRQQNENAANADRSRKAALPPSYDTGKMGANKQKKKNSAAAPTPPGETAKIATAVLANQALEAAEEAGGTAVLTPEQLPYSENNTTTVLTPDMIPSAENGTTSVLTPSQLPYTDNGSTSVLSQNQIPASIAAPEISLADIKFSIDVEYGFAESTEIIE